MISTEPMFLFFSLSLMFHGFISDFMFGPSVSPPADGFGLNKFSLVSVCLQRSWWWTKPWSWSLWEEFMAGTSSRLRSSASRWRCSRSSRRKTSSWSSSKTRILSEIPPGFRLFKRSRGSAGPAAGPWTSEETFPVCFLRYVRLLGAMYMRLTGTAVDCYKYLEPLYNDYRKIKSQNRNGGELVEIHWDRNREEFWEKTGSPKDSLDWHTSGFFYTWIMSVM